MKESGENYLETIYNLYKQGKKIKSVEIARLLSVSRPSVYKAINMLKSLDYVKQDYYGAIEITELGILKAEQIFFKHKVITAFLIKSLGLDCETSEVDACRIEHIISQKTIDSMVKYLEGTK